MRTLGTFLVASVLGTVVALHGDDSRPAPNQLQVFVAERSLVEQPARHFAQGLGLGGEHADGLHRLGADLLRCLAD